MSEVWIEQPCPEQMKRVYYHKNGTTITKEGGTVAWRNNNEGNLRPGKLSSTRIGVDKKNFAVFATPEDGCAAKRHLLFNSSSYKDLTLKQAIAKYAPSSDSNNPDSYYKYILRNANIENKVMSKYTSNEQSRIMSAMKKQEGYKEGKTTISKGDGVPTESSKNNSSVIPKYNYDRDSSLAYNKRQGYSNSVWKSIQTKINKETGLKLDVDGIVGKHTTDGVYTYQSLNKLDSDGKCGKKTLSSLGIFNGLSTDNKKESNVSIPSGSKIMSAGYTPDLDLLSRHAHSLGYSVKDVPVAAQYVSKYCVDSNSQHQCTRGTSLYLQLASYARGEAKSKYTNSCAAHLFGSANKLTSYNISSSVASEFKASSGKTQAGKSSMNSAIKSNIKKDGEFVTFQYSSSQHIVFHANYGWYSDFKQGTPSGCGNESTKYSNIHYFNL